MPASPSMGSRGTPDALALRQKAKLIAPELLVAECTNILWKKVQRQELLKQEALIAARLLQGAEIELRPMRFLFQAATRMSIEIDHPAYDCLYVAVAVETKCSFVTADERFLRKLHQGRQWRSGSIEYFANDLTFVDLPARYREVEGAAFAIDDSLDFRGATARLMPIACFCSPFCTTGRTMGCHDRTVDRIQTEWRVFICRWGSPLLNHWSAGRA